MKVIAPDCCICILISQLNDDGYRRTLHPRPPGMKGAFLKNFSRRNVFSVTRSALPRAGSRANCQLRTARKAHRLDFRCDDLYTSQSVAAMHLPRVIHRADATDVRDNNAPYTWRRLHRGIGSTTQGVTKL